MAERLPVRYCRGKACYDKRQAQTAANSRFREDHVRLRLYPCPDCGYWHLTKKL